MPNRFSPPPREKTLNSKPRVHWSRPVAIVALAVAVILFVVLLLVGSGLWISVVVGLVAGALVACGLLLASDAVVRSMLGARSADPDRDARFFNQVEALCLANGIVEPELYVLEEPEPSAMAFGWRTTRPSIVVSAGLLDSFPIIELEAVIAHLLSRIRSGCTRADTVVAVFVALPLAPFGGMADRAAARFLAPQTEIRADLDGVKMTRYPPGLIKALVTMQTADPQLQSPARAIRHMWIHEKSPARAGEWPASLTDRISILREL